MIIRPYKSCDAECIAEWCSERTVFENWGGERFGQFPINADIINDKYLNKNGDCTESDNFYPMTAAENGRPLGHFIIRYTNGDRRILRFGWVIVDSNIRGKGIGRAMLKLALKYAFQILGAEKVTIGVFEHNQQAYRCYRAVGFDTAPSAPHEENVVELEIKKDDYDNMTF